jgi:hypothetical protein
MSDPRSGKSVLRVSEWAALPLGWFPVHGISIGGLRELVSLVAGLMRSWIALHVGWPANHPDSDGNGDGMGLKICGSS